MKRLLLFVFGVIHDFSGIGILSDKFGRKTIAVPALLLIAGYAVPNHAASFTMLILAAVCVEVGLQPPTTLCSL